MVTLYTMLVLACGIVVAILVGKNRSLPAFGLALAVILCSVFLQASANYVLSHRGFGYSYYNRY